MPRSKSKAAETADYFGEWSESLFKLQEKATFSLWENGNVPYPGHMLLFLLGFKKAADLGDKCGGLTGYSVYDYRNGIMNLDFELAEPQDDLEDELRAYLEGLANVSQKVCVLCGEENVAVSDRFVPFEWMMPLCSKKDHTDELLDRLIEQEDYPLNDMMEEYLQRKKLRRAKWRSKGFK